MRKKVATYRVKDNCPNKIKLTKTFFKIMVSKFEKSVEQRDRGCFIKSKKVSYKLKKKSLSVQQRENSLNGKQFVN